MTGIFEPDPNLPHNLKRFSYDHFFLEIPINGRYEFNSRKFIPYVEMGIAPHLYLTTHTITVTEIDKEQSWNRFKQNRTINWVAHAAFGFNYAFNDRRQLFFQSNARYHLNNLEKNGNENGIKENFYNFGLETGLRFRL